MFLDHVTVAVPDLTEPLARFGAAGMEMQYGGVHSNGITHMALASFRDGSYLEVVAPVKEDGRVALWSDYLVPPQGGTAWTIASNNIEEDLGHAHDRGIPSRGPVTIHRTKPDGSIGNWELAYLGDAAPGGTLPFLIHDNTPREIRVPRTAVNRRLEGWSAIVLAVHDQQVAARTLMQLYDWSAPVCEEGFTHFPGTPVYLHSPADHLREFGESPWAGILSPSPEEAPQGLRFTSAAQWMHKRVQWLDVPLNSFRIGVETL